MTTTQGSKELEEIMQIPGLGEELRPKPSAIIKKLLQIGTHSDSIVLDFFSGSATTAHAVMQLNAEDGGKRKFIMVQLPEECPKDSKAAKAGYKNICEIGKERIRRAGENIMDAYAMPDSPNKEAKQPYESPPPDLGFRVFKLDTTNMTDVYYSADEYTQDMIMDMASNIKPNRTDTDLLYGCLLNMGLPLSKPHSHEEIDGFTIHNYDNGGLIACFNDSVSETAIRAIAGRKPARAVFRDSSFTSAPEKINVFEIFKLLSPNTKVRVI